MSDAAMNAAQNAARGALRTGGVFDAETVARVVAAAVEAYVRQRPMESVALLRPMPGDTVLFHVRGMTMQEFDEFSSSLEPFRRQHPGVLFAAAEFEKVSVVRPLVERPEGRQERRERLRVELETLEAEELRGEVAREKKRCGFAWAVSGNGTACDIQRLTAHDCRGPEHDESQPHRCWCGATHLGTIKAKSTDLGKLREVANRPMPREEFDRITGGEKQDG